MSKTLYLIRHSYAEDIGDKPDFDRSLTLKGQSNVRSLGRYLISKSFNPGIIYCSTAFRTRETATNLVEELSISESIIDYLDVIYNASVRELMELVNKAHNDHQEIAIIGHNPAITYFGEYLTGEGIENMEPCGIVTIRFKKLKWGEISQGVGSFVSYYHPK